MTVKLREGEKNMIDRFELFKPGPDKCTSTRFLEQIGCDKQLLVAIYFILENI